MNYFLLMAVVQIIFGLRLFMAGFRKELRQARVDDEPVIRSPKVDRLVQVVCFTLGVLFIVAGLFMLVMFIVGLLRD